jgi:hypothetical protein
MDGQRFDAITRTLASTTPRRSLLRRFFGGALGSLAAGIQVGASGAATCLGFSKSCRRNADCCSGYCKNKKCSCPSGTVICQRRGTCVPNCTGGKVLDSACRCVCRGACGLIRNLEDTRGWDDAYCEVCSADGCVGDPGCTRAGVPYHEQPAHEVNSAGTGQYLRLTHYGGPSYANVMYQILLYPEQYPGITDATSFELDLRFRYRPKTTFNNTNERGEEELSRIQAIEFAVRKWVEYQRWDWELQWDLIPGPNQGPPQWKILGQTSDGKDDWVRTGEEARLPYNIWHQVVLRGSISGGRTRYDGYAINGQEGRLPSYRSFPPFTTSFYNWPVVSVHVQLDGPHRDAQNDDFEIFLNQVNLGWKR